MKLLVTCFVKSKNLYKFDVIRTMYIKKKFFVEGLNVFECHNEEDLREIMKEGMRNRRIDSHEMNKDSSRSHSILTIYIVKEF